MLSRRQGFFSIGMEVDNCWHWAGIGLAWDRDCTQERRDGSANRTGIVSIGWARDRGNWHMNGKHLTVREKEMKRGQALSALNLRGTWSGQEKFSALLVVDCQHQTDRGDRNIQQRVNYRDRLLSFNHGIGGGRTGVVNKKGRRQWDRNY
jgi:hypothetical protein